MCVVGRVGGDVCCGKGRRGCVLWEEHSICVMNQPASLAPSCCSNGIISLHHYIHETSLLNVPFTSSPCDGPPQLELINDIKTSGLSHLCLNRDPHLVILN